MRRMTSLRTRIAAWMGAAGARDVALAGEAARLLDRFGGDVLAATRWCNDAMRRAEAAGEPAAARRALALRRAVGRIWADRIGVRG